MIEKAVLARTKEGTSVGNVIHQHILPQKTLLPAISFFTITDLPYQTTVGSAGLSDARIQVSVWSNSLREAEQITEELRDLWQGFIGTVANVDIIASSFADVITQFERMFDKDATDIFLYQVTSELFLKYVVPVPE